MEVVRLLRELGRDAPGLHWKPLRRLPRVLLVEDNPQLRDLAEDASRTDALPFDLKTAANAEDGLVVAAQFRPEVILLDYFFSHDGLQGDQALAFIRKTKQMRGVRVVGLAPRRKTADLMMRAGADAVLLKPYGLQELRDAIQPRKQAARIRTSRA